MKDPIRIVHVFPSFAAGGAQMRMCALANHFGDRFSHAIVALDNDTTCRDRLESRLDIGFPSPPSTSTGFPRRLRAIGRTLRALRPDLLLTSNWGSIEWAIANRLGGRVRHIHTEDGFGPDERDRQIRRRVITRRLILRSSTTIVPSRTLFDVAACVWQLPRHSLHYIPNGIDLARFSPAVALPDTPVIGCVAALRPEKNLARLIRAAAIARREVKFELRILGDGPDRAALEHLAAELGMPVMFLGARSDAASFYREISLFALSSDTEQMPLSVMEAMASGLPVITTDVGDISRMVAAENRPFIVRRDDAALAAALSGLIIDPERAHMIGRANRARAIEEFDFAAMARKWSDVLMPVRRTGAASTSNAVRRG